MTTNVIIETPAEIPYHKQRGTSKPVVKIKDGVVIKTYRSINEAARDNNIYASNISDIIHGVCSSIHGYEWKYLDYEIPEGMKRQSKKKISVNKQCKVIFEKLFENKILANEFIKEKNLTDAKIITTRNRSKKQ